MSDQSNTPSPGKEFGLLVLVALWLLVGQFGHDPWKPDELPTFGIAYSLLQGGDWAVPTVAGAPFVEYPPLFPATAAVFAAAASAILPLHEGARLATVLYMGLALVSVVAAAGVLYGRDLRWTAVLLFGGCLGLWDRAHQLIPDTALLAGVAVGTLGLALAAARPLAAGLALGMGIGMAFLATGVFGPVLLGATALLLCVFPQWRNRQYVTTLAVAVVVALPWLLIWPMALHDRSPVLFDEWLWDRNLIWLFGVFTAASSRDSFFYLRNLPWFTWPAWPLALWALHLRWRGFQGGLAQPGIQVPATMTLVGMVMLALLADTRSAYALPLLVPVALLGTAGIDTLKRGYSAGIDWFGLVFWGFAAFVLWVLWIQSVTTGMAPAIARFFDDAQRGYTSPIQPAMLVFSILLTLLWFAIVRPARRTNRRAILNWFAGATMVWGLVMTLWLPYQEARRSYRPVAAEIRVALPGNVGCVASRGLGEAQQAAFHYYIGLITVPEQADPEHGCPWVLAQSTRSAEEPPIPAGWKRVWEGARRGDGREVFRLYHRTGSG